MVPKLARIGCAAKIDRTLRKHLVLQTESKLAAQRELFRLAQTDRDPALQRLIAASKRADFSLAQRQLLAEADVVGVTCASAVNPLLQEMTFQVLILDEASQMTEPLSLLPMACARPQKMLIFGDPQQLPPVTTGNESANPFNTLASPAPVSHKNTHPFGSATVVAPTASTSASISASASVIECDIGTAIRVDTDRLVTTDRPGNTDRPGDISRTLFDRLVLLGWTPTMLKTQYRCHPTIANICR
jgi:superfamily I DNA and/or RNA helicase